MTTNASLDSNTKKQKTEHEPKIVSPEEWIEARKALLSKERDFTNARAALAAERQSLPWHPIKDDYELITATISTDKVVEEKVKFSQLFSGDNNDVLIVWHFMFSGGNNGCSLCSFFLDGINGIYEHLKPRANFAVIAVGPAIELAAVGVKKNWSFPLFSCANTSFATDYGVAFTDEQLENGTAFYNYGKQQWKYGNAAPGLSVFQKKDGRIYHTYSTYGPGMSDFNATFSLLDCIPEGRKEEMGNMWWVKHKELYSPQLAKEEEHKLTKETIPPMTCAGLLHRGLYRDIGTTFQKFFGLLKNDNDEMGLQQHEILGLYLDDPLSTPTDLLRSYAALKVTNDTNNGIPKDFETVEIPGGTVAVLTVQGDYGQLNDAWSSFVQRIHEQGWKIKAPTAQNKAISQERYVTMDPNDSSKNITKLCMFLEED